MSYTFYDRKNFFFKYFNLPELWSFSKALHCTICASTATISNNPNEDTDHFMVNL